MRFDSGQVSESISRRNLLKYSGLSAAVAMAGCTGANNSGSNNNASGSNNSMSTGERPVNVVGLGLYASSSQGKRYREETGIDLKIKSTDSATVQQEILGNNTTFDAAALDATVQGAFESAGALQPIPTSKLNNWGPNKITKAFLEPEKRLSHLGKQAKKQAEIMWQDPNKKENLMLPPLAIGFDGIAHNPKFIEGPITSWGPVFDKQYAGNSMFMGIPINAIPEPMMYLADKNVIDAKVGELNNPTKKQVDGCVDFLTKKKKAGQFRAIWTNGGQATNLLTSEEANIGDLWRANLPGLRSSGTPARYSTMDSEGLQGWRYFVGSIMATTAAKKRNNLDEVYELEDQGLGAWYGNRAGNIMFGVAQYPNKKLVRDGSGKYGQGMGPEFYDWAYHGKKTYQKIDNPDMFVPSEYDWSMEEGNPDPNGQAYNGGTIEDRFDNAGLFQIYPDTGDYIQNRFRDFMNA